MEMMSHDLINIQLDMTLRIDELQLIKINWGIHFI